MSIAEVVTSKNNFVNGRFEKAAGLGILPGLVHVAGRQCPQHENINRRKVRSLRAEQYGSRRVEAIRANRGDTGTGDVSPTTVRKPTRDKTKG